MNNEGFKLPEEAPVEGEVEILQDVNEQNSQKRGVFIQKSKNAARAMLFAATMTAGLGTAETAEAQTKSQGHEKEASLKNVTESGTWSTKDLEAIKTDVSKVKTDADAEWVAKEINSFFIQFYMPTKGILKEGVYGLKQRVYTDDDRLLFLENAKGAREILAGLGKDHMVAGLDKYLEQADDVITKLEQSTSLSGQKEREALEKLRNIIK